MNSRSPFLAPDASLYVVATPLGNLSDITLRAIEVLRGVDAIGCEDTRHARRLLDQHGIAAPCFPLHEHNEQSASDHVIELLRQGKHVALISDAGTPGVSDPGSRAVARVRSAGLPVIPVPGANAAIAALSVAGLADERFLFVGFLPPKSAARRAEIEQLRTQPAALVIYEAPHRIAECVADLAALLEPERHIVIAREITKLHEQIVRMPLAEASTWLAGDDNRRRGEFVLVLSGPPPRIGLDADTERVLRLLLADLPTKAAVRLAAEITGAPRNALYERALELKSL